jgi:hypothetical protein
MSTSIPVAFEQKFKTDFILLSQQQGSKLRDRVRTDPDYMDAKFVHFDRIGDTQMIRRTTRHADTVLVSTRHSRRRGPVEDYEWADLIDRQDLMRMSRSLGQVVQKYALNAAWAAGREYDNVIIAAMNGNAIAVDDSDVTSTEALPSAQKVTVQAAGLTLGKMIQAREIFGLGDVDLDNPMNSATLVVSPKQMTNLLNITELKSRDFNERPVLVDGKVVRVMGWDVIETNRLTTDGSNNRLCLLFAKSAVGFGILDDIFTDVGPRRDKGNTTQVYVAQSMGAVRIEDEKVVQIACLES